MEGKVSDFRDGGDVDELQPALLIPTSVGELEGAGIAGGVGVLRWCSEDESKQQPREQLEHELAMAVAMADG